MAGGLETAQEGTHANWSLHAKHIDWINVRHT